MPREEKTVTINKQKLIDQIKENKANHIKDYEEAVIAYKEEAKKQLATQSKRLKEGKLNISLKLVSPVNKSEEYDKIIELFEWEVNEQVVLTHDQFKEYVQDETTFSINAKFLNSTYR